MLLCAETKAAVTDPDAEGIEYIDEKVDGENNNNERGKVTRSEAEDESEEESEAQSDALHINRVNLRKGPRGDERERLRVCVEITHPALKLPVYRAWTGTITSNPNKVPQRLFVVVVALAG